ncbi:hypothetical protein ATCC90586_010413 [Pythium insidiosum]|nr:hypothetical protein ATCC90586_010413 [Pythium insidiosum]
MFGQRNAGPHFFCHHHFLCRGKTQDGRSCTRKATFGIYCCAAHDPKLNWLRPRAFRDDTLMLSRRELLDKHDHEDFYTQAGLDEAETHRDHVVECQVASHVFNGLYRRYRDNGWGVQEISDGISVVREFLNDEPNLVPVHQDINVLKGSGITSFLDERAFNGYALFTTHLRSACERLSARQLDGMMWTRLTRATTYNIKKAVGRQMQTLVYTLDNEADNETMHDLTQHFEKLRVNIKNT